MTVAENPGTPITSGTAQFGGPAGVPLVPVGTAVGVRVPASSANLGPGFDSLGLALSLHDEITVSVFDGEPGAVHIEVTGEAADDVPKDESHLVVRAIVRGLAHAGCAAQSLHIKCHNRIPHSRGLGSSASAVVGGVAAAAALVAQSGIGRPLTVDDMVQLSSEFEGHPDNASASVLGSAVLSWSGESGDYHARTLPVHPDIRAYALVPAVESATSQMRGLLPDSVPRVDAVFNVSRVALLTHALTVEPALLMTATQDRLHQNYRASALPESSELVRTLRDAGYPAMISGAGPTVLVLTDSQLDDATEAAVTSANFSVLALEIAPGVSRFSVD